MIASLPHLKEGDVVDIVAPASACPPRDLRLALRFVRSLGLKPRVSKRIFGKTKILANTDAERFRQLKAALYAKDSAAVWCIRGGYGSIRLLPSLAKLRRPKRFKLLLGYSDITTLHMYLNSIWRWPSIHSPMVGRFGRGDATRLELREVKEILFGGGNGEPMVHRLIPVNKAAKVKRKIRGAVVGGNLATLQGSLATPWSIKSKGRILFFEDIDERPHRLDRMLTQMDQAGIFKQCKAVVFGDMTLTSLREKRLVWNHVIPDFASRQKIPVLKGLKAGHGSMQRPIPFLTHAELNLGSSPRLEISLRPV